ncbi:MAG: polysaccharide export protein [Isosphaera sp.]|nr:polysaccharide export protein [Isosphaera sp.]
MGKHVRRVAAAGVFLLAAAGCSTLGETLGISSPTNPLSKDAKAIRDTVPSPAPVPRELALELLPAHVVEPGDTLLVQPVELDSPLRLPPDQPVQPDGTIDLGLYGRPLVAGKTLAQVEELVRAAIRAREKDAKDRDPKDLAVTVRLVGRAGKVFYVLGEVNAPGAFPITGRDTVLSAITQAGGPTRRASVDNTVLSRPTLPEGCRVVLPVCYTNVVQLGDTSTNYQLHPGDRVFVPSKTTRENLLPARFQQTPGACCGTQVSCYAVGGCAPQGKAVIQAAPAALP